MPPHRPGSASIEAVSQAEAAEQFGVSRSAVQRAKSVLDHGDQALIDAVESDDLAVSLAAKADDPAGCRFACRIGERGLELILWNVGELLPVAILPLRQTKLGSRRRITGITAAPVIGLLVAAALGLHHGLAQLSGFFSARSLIEQRGSASEAKASPNVLKKFVRSAATRRPSAQKNQRRVVPARRCSQKSL
jgi:hypothetical protein